MFSVLQNPDDTRNHVGDGREPIRDMSREGRGRVGNGGGEVLTMDRFL
jgi:hypothetical protein